MTVNVLRSYKNKTNVLHRPQKFTFFTRLGSSRFVIRASSFLGHSSFVLRHSIFSDINPPLRLSRELYTMKYRTICLTIAATLSSLSCGGSGTSTTPTDQSKPALTSHSPPPQSSHQPHPSHPPPNTPTYPQWTILL